MTQGEPKKINVIYHANCVDGFASAFLVSQIYGDLANYHACQYGQPYPEFSNSAVIIVDFSFNRSILNAIAANNIDVLVLDHHKTAQDELQQMYYPAGDSEKGPVEWRKHPELALNINVRFDMKKSGALMTWEYYHGAEEAPYWVDLISIRDLWYHKKPEYQIAWEAPCEAFNAAVNSYPFDFAVWRRWFDYESYTKVQIGFNTSALISEGTAIQRFRAATVTAICAGAKVYKTRFGEIPVVNANGMFASEVGDKLNKGYAHSISWFADAHGNAILSFRSDQNSLEASDVSAIAKHYGGGGHKNAAGCKMPMSEFLNRFIG